MLLTFALAVFGWIIFRATGMKTLSAWISGICDTSLFSVPYLMNRQYYIPLAISILILILVEWINRTNEHGLSLNIDRKYCRWIIYLVMGIFILFYICCNTAQQEFIYFQF